jgi:hypothetical protein
LDLGRRLVAWIDRCDARAGGETPFMNRYAQLRLLVFSIVLVWMILFLVLAGVVLAADLPVPAYAPGALPDHTLTPGAADSKLTKDVLCAKGFSTKTIRHVMPDARRKAFKNYAIVCGKVCGKKFELDHLISLEIGGTNDLTNLWPQSYLTKPYNAHVKDALENQLHKLVCAGTITLEQAQTEISTDWIASYKLRGGLPWTR